MQISINVARRLMAGTCAVACLRTSIENYMRDRSRESIFIVGSAFLVRPTTAITNRHVLQGLKEFQLEQQRSDDDLYLWFMYPRSTGSQEAYCRIKRCGVLSNDELDVGMIEFVRRPEPQFEVCQPVAVAPLCAPEIGEAISVCGFPYGVDTFASISGRPFSRVGPILQQGYISATAPSNFCQPALINELILDVRTAEGMSGAPVVSNKDGTVIGIHYSGWGATMAAAIPLDAARLSNWLTLHDPEHTPQP